MGGKLAELPGARLVGMEGAAALCGVSVRAVYRLVDSGQMPAPIKLGGVNRWDVKKLEAWIDGGCKGVRRRRVV